MRLTGGRNMQKRKIAIIGASCVAAATLIVGSALALFTDETESDAAAKAGTVKIDVSPITFTNAGNVNPGDNDPTISPDAHSGTTHDVKYVVSNLGNKSVKTRQTIILTCDEQGSSTKLLDARYLALYNRDAELSDKTYISSEGKSYSDISEFDSDVDKPQEAYITAVKYTYFSDSFEGFDPNAEKEDGFSVVAAKDDTVDSPVEKEYSYSFSLLKDASNQYQGADITVDVIVEAMQYRNTESSDWDVITKVEKVYSSADVPMTVVPKEDEDASGNKITISRGGNDKSNSQISDARDKALS